MTAVRLPGMSRPTSCVAAGAASDQAEAINSAGAAEACHVVLGELPANHADSQVASSVDVHNAQNMVDQLEDERQWLQDALDKLKGDIRHQHAIMCSLVSFAKVPTCSLVEQALEGIVRYGWDSIQWHENYSLLHYATQCVDDTSVLELLALLATDVDHRDDRGMRPIDYARTRGGRALSCLEKIRSDRRRCGFGHKTARSASSSENKAGVITEAQRDKITALEEQLAQMPGLTSVLRKELNSALESCKRGSAAQGLFAAHRAAQCGHKEALAILAEAGADLGGRDNYGLTPLDYAAQGGHRDAIEYLQAWVSVRPRGEAKRSHDSCMEQVWPGSPRAEMSSPGESPRIFIPRSQSGDEAENEMIPCSGSSALSFAGAQRVPSGLPPELERACRAVLSRGWHKVRFPHNFTALHLAARIGSEDGVRFLLEAGAHPGLALQDDRGLTPVDYARQKGHVHLRALLCDSIGRKPSDDALESQNPSSATGSSISSALALERERMRRFPTPVPEEGRIGKSFHLASGSAVEQEGGAELLEAAGSLASCAPNNVGHGGALSGPLTDLELKKYWTHLLAFGREAVQHKLTEPSLSGGLGLCQTKAALALKQLDFVMQLCEMQGNAQLWEGKLDASCKSEEANVDTGESTHVDGSDGAEQHSVPGPAGKGPGKGKGKPSTPSRPEQLQSGDNRGHHAFAVEPTKPVVTPKVAMKPLWWTRMIMGQHLKPGESIWDEVKDDMEMVPIEQLEQRFSKTQVASGTRVKDVNKKASEQPETLLRIIKDSRVIVGKEAALRGVPPAQEVARALNDLREDILGLDSLRVVRDHCCPTVSQMKQLSDARDEHPSLPMAVTEQYMWVIGNMPAYQQRIDCWIFTRTFPERAEVYESAVSEFEAVIDCFIHSTSLPSLLGLILAVGNYMNGGTSRGRADGFNLDFLAKLGSVKDPAGRDIRYFVLDLFLRKREVEARGLLEELCSAFLNVIRHVSKDSDGEKMTKRSRVVLEDLDVCVTSMQDECAQREETMKVVLQYIDDPVDAFRNSMPQRFADAKDRMGRLLQSLSRVRERYNSMLRWFKVSAMKSSDFFLLWDDFFIPSDLMLSRDEKVKREVLFPFFCNARAFGLPELRALWGLPGSSHALAPSSQRERAGPSSRRRPPKSAAAGAAASAAADME